MSLSVRPVNRPVVVCGPGRTKQEFKKECDINQILKRAKKTGVMPMGITAEGKYGDFSEIGEYMDMQLKVVKAKEDFMKLPAKIRSRFHNEPGELLDFIMDPANLEEAKALKIVEVKEAQPLGADAAKKSEVKEPNPVGLRESPAAGSQPAPDSGSKK